MYQDLPRSVRLWGMWCHLSAIVCAPCNAIMISFVSLVVPYLVWVAGRDKHPFINEQGKESLNFQISMALYTIAAGILFVFLFFLTCGVALSSQNLGDAVGNIFALLAIAFVILVALFVIFQMAVIILAAVKAYNGQSYRYPFALRFLR